MIITPLSLTPAIDIDKTTQASNHLVMSKADLVENMKYNGDIYQLDSIPPSGTMADIDLNQQSSLGEKHINELNTLHNNLSKEVSANSTKTIEFGDNNTLDIEIKGENYGLSIVGGVNERFFCIEKNGKKMILARGKPIMAGSATSKFFKKFYLSVADPTTNKIFNEGQEFGLLDSLTTGINKETGETYLKISADYVIGEKDTTHIDPTIALSTIEDLFDAKMFEEDNQSNQKTLIIPMGEGKKQELAWGLVGTDSLLNKSLDDLILEGLSIEQAEHKLRQNEKKKQEKYEDYLGDFDHIKAIEFTYKQFNE